MSCFCPFGVSANSETKSLPPCGVERVSCAKSLVWTLSENQRRIGGRFGSVPCFFQFGGQGGEEESEALGGGLGVAPKLSCFAQKFPPR